MKASSTTIHATAVAVNGQGLLLLGKSGAGKSDLALRLIDRGALLISDDRVRVDVTGPHPILGTAPNIETLIEIRGVGICYVPATPIAPLRLVASLEGIAERLPPETIAHALAGFDVPFVRIAPFEASAPIKLEYALRSVVDADRWPVPQGATIASESQSS